jgi:hypothetical protein
MKRSKRWSKVLDLEIQRWSAMPYEELLSTLKHLHTYEIEIESTKYQVEVEILQKTDRYLQVMVAVDDGSLPASIFPVCHTFICRKEGSDLLNVPPDERSIVFETDLL